MSGGGDIRTFLREHPCNVRVDLVVAEGSTPRESGTWMLVSQTAIFQTIGGGQLEYLAIERARRMLDDDERNADIEVPLGPEIGQCCGGRVRIELARMDDGLIEASLRAHDAALAARPHVYLFGAGHVGSALAQALTLLPVRVVLVDTREAELARAPQSIETCLVAMPEAIVRDAPPGSAFVVLTHDHSLDFMIVAEALKRDDAAYVGMIGSKTKRATFSSWYRKQGGSEQAANRLVCPIGATSVSDKRPAVIAGFVAAEIMTVLLER